MQHVTAVSWSIPFVQQAAAAASMHKVESHVSSEMHIETAAFASGLILACIWSAGQHAEPTCESSTGVACFITVVATAASEQTTVHKTVQDLVQAYVWPA